MPTFLQREALISALNPFPDERSHGCLECCSAASVPLPVLDAVPSHLSGPDVGQADVGYRSRIVMATVTRASHLPLNAQRITPSSKVRTYSDAGSLRSRLSVGKISRHSMTDSRFASSAKDQSDGLFAYRQQGLAFFRALAAALMKRSSSLVPGGQGISRIK